MDTKITTSLIDRLHLMERFNQIVPSTLEGQTLVEKYKSIFEKNSTVTAMHNFLYESKNTNDPILNEFAQVESDGISCNNSNGWKFNLILEGLAHSGFSLNEAIVDDLFYLTSYDEVNLSEAIFKGALKTNLHIPGLKALHEGITGDKQLIKLSEAAVMYSPISYVEVKNNEKYFMLESIIYKVNEDGELSISPAPSNGFTQINNAINQIPYNPEVDEFELDFLPGAVNVTTDGRIFKDKEQIGIDDLRQELQDKVLSITGYTDVQKMHESRKFDALKLMLENLDNVVKMDNVTAVTNTLSENTTYLYTGSNKHYMLTESGIANSSIMLTESISAFNKHTGVNLRKYFTKQLNEELASYEQNTNLSNSLTEQLDELTKVMNTCNEEMKFCEKDSPKYKEFVAIYEDAKEQHTILSSTKSQLMVD